MSRTNCLIDTAVMYVMQWVVFQDSPSFYVCAHMHAMYKYMSEPAREKKESETRYKNLIKIKFMM